MYTWNAFTQRNNYFMLCLFYLSCKWKADVISVVPSNCSNSPYLTICPTNKNDIKVPWIAS